MSTPTLFIQRSSGLHALHPLTKVAMMGVFFVAAATLPNIYWLLAIYTFGLLPLAAWGRVLQAFLRSNLILIWPFALSLFLIQGFFAHGEYILLKFGPLSLKEEGLWLAAHFTTRLLVWLGAATLMMIATRPDRLMLALIQKGLPHQIAYIILTSLQIIPRFQEKAEGILDAQRSRGLETEGSLIHRMRMLVPLVAPLILSSVLELDERAIALEARAFSRRGPRTSLTELADSKRQSFLRWVLLIAILALIAAWILRLRP